MEDNISTEDLSVPEQVPTADPAPEDITPEAEPVESPKTFTQEEMDEILAKRIAREKRRLEREYSARQQQTPQLDAPISPDQFNSNEEFEDARVQQKALELMRQQKEIESQRELTAKFESRIEAFEEKFPDFEQIAKAPTHHVTDVMAQAIISSELGPEIAYHLGLNPKESNRIATLPPLEQIKAIGRLEVKLADNPPAKKTSSAPAPISPVTARGNAKTLDTTDPKAATELSMEEWARKENERVRKKLASRI